MFFLCVWLDDTASWLEDTCVLANRNIVKRHFSTNSDKHPKKNCDWIRFWNDSWDVCHNSSKHSVSRFVVCVWLEDGCVLSRRHMCPGWPKKWRNTTFQRIMTNVLGKIMIWHNFGAIPGTLAVILWKIPFPEFLLVFGQKTCVSWLEGTCVRPRNTIAKRDFLKNYDKRPRINYDWTKFWNDSRDICHNFLESGVSWISFWSVWLDGTCVLAKKTHAPLLARYQKTCLFANLVCGGKPQPKDQRPLA